MDNQIVRDFIPRAMPNHDIELLVFLGVIGTLMAFCSLWLLWLELF